MAPQFANSDVPVGTAVSLVVLLVGAVLQAVSLYGEREVVVEPEVVTVQAAVKRPETPGKYSFAYTP